MTLPTNAEDSLARAVLGPCLAIRPKEVVTIETWSHALPWALALVREVRRRRAEPILVLEEEETFFQSLRFPKSPRVPLPSPALIGASDVYIYLPGPEAFPRLFGLGPLDLHTAVVRHSASWWSAARARRLRVARLSISSVTPTAADHFGIEIGAWQGEVFRASLFPPGQLHRKGVRLARCLEPARRIRIRHPNGTDLRLRLRPGRAVVEDGRVDVEDRREGHLATQIPSGLVAVRVDPKSAEGVWESNRQIYLRFQEPPVTVASRFVFRDGRLREYTFDRGGESFAAVYANAGRGRDLVSRLTFGLNPAVGFAAELEEIAAGTVTLWLGDDRSRGSRHTVPFSFVSPLGGADVEVDGVRIWAGGRPVRRRVARREEPTQDRTALARRTDAPYARQLRGAGERSARR